MDSDEASGMMKTKAQRELLLFHPNSSHEEKHHANPDINFSHAFSQLLDNPSTGRRSEYNTRTGFRSSETTGLEFTTSNDASASNERGLSITTKTHA